MATRVSIRLDEQTEKAIGDIQEELTRRTATGRKTTKTEAILYAIQAAHRTIKRQQQDRTRTR